MIDQLFRSTTKTVTQLSRRSGIPEVSIWRWKNHGATPRLDLFLRLAHAAGMQITMKPYASIQAQQDDTQLALNLAGTTTIRCKSCGREEEYRSEDQARRQARKAGWKFNKTAKYCGDCYQ